MRIAAAVLALALAACAPPPPPPPPAPAPQPNLLVDTRWVAEEGGLNAPSIEFSESRANGDTGCNRWFAQVTTSGEALVFGGVATTRRACAPAVMEIERNFISVLGATQTGRIDGDALILTDADGAELARFTRHR